MYYILSSPQLSQVCAHKKHIIPSILLRVKMLMYVRKFALMLVPNTFTSSVVTHHRTIFVFQYVDHTDVIVYFVDI